jgi:hypothetical protein
MGSSLGVGVGVGSRASFSVRCQLVLHVLFACLQLHFAPCLDPSLAALSGAGFALQHRVVSAWARMLLYCRLLIQEPVNRLGSVSLYVVV